MGEVRIPDTKGLSLIEVMIVMTILALSAGLVGPRIGAGFTRLEVNQAEETLRSFVQIARLQAQRTDQGHFIVADRDGHRVLLLDPDMAILRERSLPSGVNFVPEANGAVESIYVPPSGLLRAQVVRLRSRLGDSEVILR
jgi:prepilin-type N-terminal cleavage/methylation domain-containing protein